MGGAELRGVWEEGFWSEEDHTSLENVAPPPASTLQTESQTFVKGQILAPDSSSGEPRT